MRPYAIADGHSIGSFYGFVTDGIWNSREEVINSKQFQTQYPDYTVNGSDAATEEIIVETGSVNLNIKILMKTVLSQTRIKHGLEMQIQVFLWIQYGPDLEEFRFQHSFSRVWKEMTYSI